MAAVEFNRESYNKCLCGGCPVQRHSPCVVEKEKRLAPKKEAIEKEARMPEPANMLPGVYCSPPVGKSECADLKGEKVCLCPACGVFFQHDLKNNYYCVGR